MLGNIGEIIIALCIAVCVLLICRGVKYLCRKYRNYEGTK